MKRLLTSILAVIFTVCLAFSLVGCGEKNVTPPSAVNGQDTVMTGLKKTPDNYDAATAIYAALGKLDSYTTYKSQSSGTSTAKKGIVSYTQTTTATAIKHGDEFYADTESHSAFVNFRHEAFAKNDNVAYRVNGKDIKNVVRASYESVYGITPAKLLTGHIYNQNTIVSASGKKVDGGYEYKVALDKNEANAKLAYQMKEFGGLGGYPVFSENTLVTIVIKDDFTPVSATYTSKYTVNVPVLGDMECTESNSVTFSDFNGDLEIPDTAAFNAAMDSTPSEIDPNKPAEKSGLDKIAASLINLNFRDGVSLTGSIYYNDISVPFKLSGKADVDGLIAGTKKTAEAFDFTLSAGTLDGKIGVTYHDGTFYANLAGMKVAFATDVSAVNELDLDFNDAESIISKLKEVLTVEESETEKDTYIISLNDEYNDLLGATLKNLGIITEEEFNDFDCAIKVYMPDDRINAVYAAVAAGEKEVGISATIANELYSVPESFDEYETELALGAELNLALSTSTGMELGANCKVSALYDTTITDVTKAFKAEAKITLDDTTKGLLGFAGMMGIEGLPEWLPLLGTADEIIVAYGDGAFGVAFVLEGKAIFVQEIEIGKDSAPDIDLDDLTSIDFSSIISMLPEFVEFNFDRENSVIELKVKDNIIELVNSLLWNQLTDVIMDNVGDMGVFVIAMLGTSDPLAGVNLKLDMTTGELSLNLELYNVGAGYVYNPALEYDKYTLLSLSLKASDEISDFSFDISAAIENDKAAAVIRERISALKEIALTDEYFAKFAVIRADYEALTEDEQKLVYNYDKLDEYESEATNQKSAVDKFAKAENKSDKTYNKFNRIQLDYFSAAYPEIAQAYLDGRAESETKKLNDIVSDVNALGAKIDALGDDATTEEIIAALKSVSGLLSQINGLCLESAEHITSSTPIVSIAEKIADRYAKITLAEAESILSQLKEMSGALGEFGYFDKTVDEMLEFYNDYSSFYEDRCSNLSNLAIWEYVLAAEPQTAIVCGKINAYFQLGLGFKTGAVKTAIDAIDELNADEMTAEELAVAIEKIEELIDLTDKNAITNMAKLKVFTNAATIRDYTDKITSAANGFENLTAEEVEKANDLITAARKVINGVSDEQKTEIAETVSACETAVTAYKNAFIAKYGKAIKDLYKELNEFNAVVDARQAEGKTEIEDYEDLDWETPEEKRESLYKIGRSIPAEFESEVGVTAKDFKAVCDKFYDYYCDLSF